MHVKFLKPCDNCLYPVFLILLKPLCTNVHLAMTIISLENQTPFKLGGRALYRELATAMESTSFIYHKELDNQARQKLHIEY